VHGRIVPLRAKGAGVPAPVKKQAAPAAKQPFYKTTKFRAAAIGLAVGAAAFFIARKFRLSANKKLAGLQRAVEKAGPGKFGTVTSAAEPGEKLSPIQKTFDFVSGGVPVNNTSLKKGVVYARYTNARADYKPSYLINPAQYMQTIAGKRTVGKIITKNMPKQINFEKALDKVGWSGKKLTKLMPKFLIKGDSSALSDVSAFATEKSIVMKKSLHHFANATDYVMQERLNLSGEYRAHFLNGEVFGISHRRIPHEGLRKAWNKLSGAITGSGVGGGAFIPVVSPFERKRIKDLVASSISMKGLKKNEGIFTAVDIGRTTKNELKILEANPIMGTFLNPMVNRRFKELATGRMSRAKAGAIALGAGGASYKIAKPDEKRAN